MKQAATAPQLTFPSTCWVNLAQELQARGGHTSKQTQARISPLPLSLVTLLSRTQTAQPVAIRARHRDVIQVELTQGFLL